MLKMALVWIKYLSAFFVIITAGSVGILWSIKPMRNIFQTKFSWFDESLMFGVTVALLAVLLNVLLRLLMHLPILKQLTKLNNIKIIAEDQEGSADRCNYISNNKISTARLIEMSSDTVTDEVKSLLEKNVPVQLLLMHPCAIRNFPKQFGENKKDYIQSLSNHLHRIQHNKNKREYYQRLELLEEKYYHTIPSFHGRHFGKRVELSWYAQRDDQAWGVIFGHCNPTVIADTSTVEGSNLLKLFNSSFNVMWKSSQELPDKEWETEVDNLRVYIKSIKSEDDFS